MVHSDDKNAHLLLSSVFTHHSPSALVFLVKVRSHELTVSPLFRSPCAACCLTLECFSLFSIHPREDGEICHPTCTILFFGAQMKRVQLCQDFKIEGEDEWVGAALDGRISHVISQGKLVPILEVGLEGINREYVEFLLKLQGNYEIYFHRNCQAEGLDCSPRKVAENLAKEWREIDFVLPFI